MRDQERDVNYLLVVFIAFCPPAGFALTSRRRRLAAGRCSYRFGRCSSFDCKSTDLSAWGKYDWFKGGVTWIKCLNNQINTISRSFIELFVKNSVFVCSIWEVIWMLFFCWVYRIWTQPARLYKWKPSHWCKVWEKKKKALWGKHRKRNKW